MVDFQSRDSRPTYGGDEDEVDEEGAEEENGVSETEESLGETEESLGETESADGLTETDRTAATRESDVADPPAPDTTGDVAPAGETLGVAVITVDGDLAVEEDRAGGTAVEVLEDAGLAVPTREVIAAEYDNVQQNIGGLLVREDVDVIVTLGGDGLGDDDVTVDAAQALFDKELPGFGELFRAKARESIGTGVLRTRATAGIVDGVPVFCLPGTAGSARLGLSEIVLPEVPAIVEELQS